MISPYRALVDRFLIMRLNPLLQSTSPIALDVGGRVERGAWRRAQFPHVQWRVVDAEPGPEVDHAVRVEQMIEHADLAERFHLVKATDVLYMANDLTLALLGCRAALFPYGTMIATVPAVRPTVERTDFWRLTDRGWGVMMDRAGFKDIEIIPLGGLRDVVAHAWFLRGKIGRAMSAILRSRNGVPSDARWPIGYGLVGRA